MESLWIDKYCPKSMCEVAGNKKVISEISAWLDSWKRGKALFIHGPAGTGKGMIVELASKERDLLIIRMDASEQRKTADIESLIARSGNRSLFHKGNLILLDEVDGISSRDRGAVSAIAKLIKNSRCPVILIANDTQKPKLRPLKNHCSFIKFTRIPTPSLEKKLSEICSLAGVKFSGSALKSLARWSQGDMRSAITDMQILGQGRKEVTEEDLEMLGYRERGLSVFDVMPTIFHSRNINASRKAIYNTRIDPDEIFWWVETNLAREIGSPDSMAKAYETLSRADLLRKRVSVSQNWALKGYMVDLVSGISLFTDKSFHGYTAYKPPRRIIELGRTKFKRAVLSSLCMKIGKHTHSSKRRVKRDILPFLKLVARNRKSDVAEKFELTEEETNIIN